MISRVKSNLLNKLAVLCGVTAGALTAAPVLAQNALAQNNSFAPVVVPLSKDDSPSPLEFQSQPLPDTVTPTTTSPELSVIPVSTAPTPLVAPFTNEPTHLAAPQSNAPATSTLPSTFAPTPSVDPTTPAPASTVVVQPINTSTTTESTPLVAPTPGLPFR